MDELYRNLLRLLTATDPATAARLAQILGGNLTALALLQALYQLLMEGLIDRALLMRLLGVYIRSGPMEAELIELAMAEAERDLARAAAAAAEKAAADAAAKAARAARWRTGIRGGVWVALAYLLVAAVADSQIELKHGPAGKGACAVNAVPVPIDADESSYGPKSALQDAMDEINRKCAATGINCRDPLCKTCGADPFITSTEIKTRVFWYSAVVTADCRCGCK